MRADKELTTSCRAVSVRAVRRATAFATLAAVLSSTPLAWAGTDEVIAAVEPGVELWTGRAEGTWAVTGGASAWVGLTDQLWLAASANGGQVVTGNETFARYEFFGGVVLALDVFRVVPYLEVLGGVVGAQKQLFPTVRLGFGLDYLIDPEWAVGVVARVRPLPERDIATSVVGASLRLSYRFGW